MVVVVPGRGYTKMPPFRNQYDESAAYGNVQTVPGTESFTQPGQEGTYAQSVLPEYGREPQQESQQISSYDRWLDYMNPPDTVSTQEYDYRTGLRREQAQESLLMEKAQAEISKAAGAGEVDTAKAEALRKGDTTLAMIDKMPPHLQEIMRPTYILGKAGIKGQDLYDVLERIKSANTDEEKKRIAEQAATAKASKIEDQPVGPQRRGTTFIEDLLGMATGGGGAPRGELGVGEEQGIPTAPTPSREPVTRAGQGPPVEQWQRNPKTGKLERVS